MTESENAGAQRLDSHIEKLSQTGGITKEQAAGLTSEARVGGGFDFIVRIGADGSASWRGQTIGREAWSRMKDYAGQSGLLDLWSRVADASKRYASATGESEMKSLEESFGSNLTRMRRFSEQEAVSRREAESWSTQAAEVRANARSIESELGQPFFAWLAAQKGADGREIGAAGAMRLASPQTTEDAEVLRAYAAAFIARALSRREEGPEPAPDRAEYERARDGLRERGRDGRRPGKKGRASVRERAQAARGALRCRAAQAGRAANEGARRSRPNWTSGRRDVWPAQAWRENPSIPGATKVEAETEKPLGEHVVRDLPVVGEWLGGTLYGTARNAAPGQDEKKESKGRGGGSAFSGDQVMGP